MNNIDDNHIIWTMRNDIDTLFPMQCDNHEFFIVITTS